MKKLIDDGYFEKLGINTLWLSPVNQNPLPPYQEFKEPRRWYTGYHGYWPISSTEVEPRFGGNEALTALADSAEKKKISILLDLVLAHVHEEHPVFKKNPDWFGSLTLPDGTKNLRKWDNETQFTTWFEPFLPRFNYDTPGGAFLIDNAVDWVKRFHLDGFRLDAVKHIPPKYWTAFREGLRQYLPESAKDSFYLVGETFMDRPGINSFIGPNRLDGQFEFPLYDTLLEVFGTGKEDFASLERSAAASDRVFGPETVMSPLLGNHDKSRFMAYADGDLPDPKEPDEFVVGWTKPPKVDKDSSYEKLKLAFTFVLTTPGGNALKFYASVRLDIRRIGQLKDGMEVTGNRVRIKVVKNKVAPPFRQCEFDIVYGSGVSKDGEIIDLGTELNIIKKSGSWYSYGETKLGQGRDGVRQLLGDNPDLSMELEERIREKLKEKLAGQPVEQES